jgi:hypothetical protein
VRWFIKLFDGRVKTLEEQPILPVKDPNDYTLTESSTGWEGHVAWCTTCKTGRSHQEFMADCCNSCGRFHTMQYYGASTRYIWNGMKWVRQIKHKSGGMEIEN